MKRSVESQIEAFLAAYSPEISDQLRRARDHLRALFPQGHDLVYDNYNARVFAFSPTERSSEALLSVAGYLIAQAMRPHREALLRAGPLQTAIKAISEKKRSRRLAQHVAKGPQSGVRNTASSSRLRQRRH